MIPAFWDTSALIPLCVHQEPSQAVRQLLEQYEIAVWWATPIEMRSAFERLLRTGHLPMAEHAAAGMRLEALRRGWRELQPGEVLRLQAENFLMRFTLKAADSLQLAAAWVWCSGDPHSRVFLCGDQQLLEAARRMGFQTVAT